jgi:hypothetical protein
MNEVTLTFYLDEEVTPRIFAEKIAVACAKGGAIREGERVGSGIYVYEFTGHEDVDLFDQGPISVVQIEQVHRYIT